MDVRILQWRPADVLQMKNYPNDEQKMAIWII